MSLTLTRTRVAWSRAVRLTPAKAALVIRALCAVVRVRMRLHREDARTLLAEPPVVGGGGPIPVPWVGRSVELVSRVVPGATCLTQALAARALLADLGMESRFQLGVASDDEDEMLIHAWLVAEGRVVVGGPDVDRYAPFSNLEEALHMSIIGTSAD